MGWPSNVFYDLAARACKAGDSSRISPIRGRWKCLPRLRIEAKMATHETSTENDAHNLQLEVDELRKRLNNELETVAELRKEYEAECRRLVRGDDAQVLAAKQRL